MSTPYIGEIRMFGGNFAPVGWAFCQGQLLSIAEDDALFTLIGTTYGGDGQETFALPNLASRVPVHMGQGPGLSDCVIGEVAGVEYVTLTTAHLPSHTHAQIASTNDATQSDPTGRILGGTVGHSLYVEDVVNTPLDGPSLGPAGGSQPHDNSPPYLVINFIISLYGVYPSQS